MSGIAKRQRKEKECEAPQDRPISYTHTDASQALAPSTCCLSLAVGSCSFHFSFLIRLYQVMCCLILSLLKYFQRALWDKRQKALWEQTSFSLIPSGTPVIPQGMYILLIGAIANITISFFKLQHKCLHTHREKHTPNFYYFLFQSTESSFQETGGGAGRVAPHDFAQQPHPTCRAQLDRHTELYSKHQPAPSGIQSSSLSLGSHTMKQHCEMATHTRQKKRAFPEDHH